MEKNLNLFFLKRFEHKGFLFVTLFFLLPIIGMAQDEAIRDFVQIYHGYQKRPPWSKDEIKHYIYADNDGEPAWLFDGFLFLEIYAEFGGKQYDYGAAQPGKLAPGKAEWENLIGKNFENGRGPDAIEYVLDSLAKKGHMPNRKRRIVFSIPNPIYGVNNWGFITDRPLDFLNPEDRAQAIQWYIDRTLEEWEKKKYKHVEFGGFYWIHEQIDFDHADDRMLKIVNGYLKEKGIRSYWLPHYTAKGVSQWKEFGFTYVYQQPNYFFYSDRFPNAIEETIESTRKNEIGIMMEFDARVTDQEQYRQLFYNYLNTFEKRGVWTSQPVNYYDGGDGWLRLATDTSATAQSMYHALSKIIIQRQIRQGMSK